MSMKSSPPSSKTMRRVLHISATLASDYDILKICLKDDVTAEWVVSLPGSFIILLTTLITWLRHLTTVSKRWNLMTTLRITSFPLSKRQILLHGTKHFFSANQFRPIRRTLQSRTQVFLSSNHSSIHIQGPNELFGTILSTLCRTEILQEPTV